MTTEELEKIVSRHEMQKLELKEGFIWRALGALAAVSMVKYS